MARDPDEGGAFVFDLVDDDAADLEGSRTSSDVAGEGDPGDDEPGPGEAPSGGLNRSLRLLVPVAAVLAIVLGTGFAVDSMRDGARAERMRDVHGGVVDVTSPLEVTWAWAGPVGRIGDMDEQDWNEVAVLGDLLAFQSGDDLVALDPSTGAEAWRLRLGEDPDCGPQGSAGWNEAVTLRLVCLAGPDTGKVAQVVGPDGAVSAERALDAADTRRYGSARPGPDGTVLRAQRVGPEPPAGANDAECSSSGECTGTVDDGRGVRLRAEDAATGEERWSLTVPFRSTRADQCSNWFARSWDGAQNMVDLDDMLDSETFGARVTGDLVHLYGCGIQSAVTSDGVLLGLAIEPGTGNVDILHAGGYVGYSFDGVVASTLYDADGEVVGEIDGYTLQPTAVDGLGPDTLLAPGELGPRLRAYAPDGTLRWDVPAPADVQQFLAQAGGTAIVQSGAGQVRGLDLETGTERWTWAPARPGEGYAGDLYVSRAFTDGQSVLLLMEATSGGTGLVALDAVSGEVAWEQLGPDTGTERNAPRSGAGLVAVDGHLLEVAPNGVRGLG
jgi:outer membrane protein assembly factor BamB